MSRIFNIRFDHKGHSYTALVSVSGNHDEQLQITTYDDKICIMLSNGRLTFSVEDVLQLLFSRRQKDNENETVYITENISLQLLN